MSEVVDHLQNLIRIPSVSAVSNRSVVEYATDVFHTAAWTTREVVYFDSAGVEKVNLIAAPPGQNAGTRDVELAFVCHTDTVPYAADWEQALQPFGVDGMLHGCGACDVKGFLACLLAAAQSCSGKYVAGLRIVLTADEEIGCVGAARLLQGDEIRAGKMVIGEPTSLHVARAGKGYCLARLTVTGREAHSAHPDKGVSAIYGAARMVTALQELAKRLEEERNGFFSPQYTTLNVGVIQGGTAKNIIPAHCEFLVEWRPIPGVSDEDKVLAAIRQIIERFRVDDQRFECELKVLRQQAGFETSEDSSLVRSTVGMTGLAATSIPFGSEAGVFAATAEEIIVFGPGDMRTAHSDRECVPLVELDGAVRVLSRLMSEDLTAASTMVLG